MARFRGTVQGQRGEASRLGSVNSGLSVSANGWHSGVSIDARVSMLRRGDGLSPLALDVFDIYVTGGSNGRGTRFLVGMVHLTENGPTFIPEGAKERA